MRILSHRGYWLSYEEKNTETAFHRSFGLGFGTETDIRDCAGSLVVSHDPPNGSELPLFRLLELVADYDQALPLALNIKSDGIGARVAQACETAGLTNWFTFDMSVPDLRAQLQLGIKAYTRMSELELAPPLLSSAAGVWLDSFTADTWFTPKTISNLLNQGKQVCLVSPELHGSPHQALWSTLIEANLHRAQGLSLCTDLPVNAKTFFGE
jgi:hypothetical protein